jgi:hypothetical protein
VSSVDAEDGELNRYISVSIFPLLCDRLNFVLYWSPCIFGSC